MNIGVTPDERGHYVVEAYLPDMKHPGYSTFQPLRKFATQGDAMLFADVARAGHVDCERYARTYDAQQVHTVKIKYGNIPILGHSKITV